MTSLFQEAPAPITLHQLALRISVALEAAFPQSVWVVAEIAEIDIKKTGHCYLSLIDRNDDGIQAQLRGTIWAYNHKRIGTAFRKATGGNLAPGMKILFACEVSFHERWGLSLNIQEIDPTYTLGEMARRRKEIIAKLQAEGLIDLNRQIPFPLVPQRIAIISSETAAGYRDFMHELLENRYGYRFTTALFQAAMQGEQTESSVIQAMEAIAASADSFDVIVIIRGGGSVVDLSSFDSYAIGKAIAQSPLPVLTGIGHEEDETVADLVAHLSCKTPTKVAESLLSHLKQFEDHIKALMQELVTSCRRLLETESQNVVIRMQKLQVLSLNYMAKLRATEATTEARLKAAALRLLEIEAEKVKRLSGKLTDGAKALLLKQWQKIEHTEQTIRLLDPINTLKRGFSITYFEGHAVKDAGSLPIGKELTTKLYSGTITSRIEKVEGQ